jgi:hypothetical protein
MDSKTFMKLVEDFQDNDIKVLEEKEKEYSNDQDRLCQFYEIASVRGISPADALMGIAIKQLHSVIKMCKEEFPSSFSISVWEEKITDSRNYLYLLQALIMEVSGAVE